MISTSYSGASTSSNASPTALTFESVKKAMEIMDDFDRNWQRENMANIAAGLYNPFGEIALRESPLATQRTPARIHKQRRGQSSSYHKRVQKKWDKRFGSVVTPAAFVLDGGSFGMGSMFVVHPSIAKSIREQIPLRQDVVAFA